LGLNLSAIYQLSNIKNYRPLVSEKSLIFSKVSKYTFQNISQFEKWHCFWEATLHDILQPELTLPCNFNSADKTVSNILIQNSKTCIIELNFMSLNDP